MLLDGGNGHKRGLGAGNGDTAKGARFGYSVLKGIFYTNQ